MDRLLMLAYVACLMMIAGVVNYARADNHLVETRCCVDPKRYDDGRIVRSITVVKEFERLYPLPSHYNRDDWQIDHVIPLASGGVDAVRNLQWLPKTIKTCPGTECKDRWERKGIYDK